MIADACHPLDAAPTPPFPPRYRWLKRLTAAGVLFVLALVGARLWWGHVADARLQAAIAKYRAAGQPVLVQDFVTPPLAPSENAALLLKQAMATVAWAPDVTNLISELRERTAIPPSAQRFLSQTGPGRTLIRQARSLSSADWGFTPTSPVISTLIPGLSPHRQLGQALCAAALYQHALGEDDEAVESLRDVLRLCRHVSAVAPLLMRTLFRISIDHMGAMVIEEIAPRLQISSDDAADSVTSARRDPVQALIRELLDELEFRASFCHAIYGERMSALDTYSTLLTSGLTPLSPRASGLATFVVQAPYRVLQPASALAVARLMDLYADAARAGADIDWPAAQAVAAAVRVPEHESLPARTAHAFWPDLAASIDVGASYFHTLFLRRAAAVALALRLYELDHGRRPSTLAELVPSYLPAVPVDPFDPACGEIRYVPNARPPVLYSVSVNGIDDGGAFVEERSHIDWRSKDAPFFLNGDQPLPRPGSRCGERRLSLP